MCDRTRARRFERWDRHSPVTAAFQVALQAAAALAVVASTAAFASPVVAQSRVEIEARADADVQGGAPDVNYGDDVVIHVGNPDKTVFVYFDLSPIPPGATIERAQLVMTAAGSGTGPNDVAVGGVRDRWGESRITFVNQPEIAWTNRTRTVSANGPVVWNVKPAVEAWLAGEHDNFGLALRGDGPIWAFRSRETADAATRPRLRVEYTPATAPIFRTRVLSDTRPVEHGSTVSYEVQLEHRGDRPREVQIRDVLPNPLHTLGLITLERDGNVVGSDPYVEWLMGDDGREQHILWTGTLDSGARATLRFDVLVLPDCESHEGRRLTIRNVAEARSPGADPLVAEDTYAVACPVATGG
jgi:hypothetical protein